MKNRENIHILLPGKYKPFHDGHFYMINEYLNKYPNSQFTVIISGIAKMGLLPATSKGFIDRLFQNVPSVDSIISDGLSPVQEAYIIANTGIGHYAMGGTAIPENLHRSRLFTDGINPGGKYAADNVLATMEFCTNEGFKENINRFMDTYEMERYGIVPVSASNLRKALLARDYAEFRRSYRIIISVFGEVIVKNYYDVLLRQIV